MQFNFLGAGLSQTGSNEPEKASLAHGPQQACIHTTDPAHPERHQVMTVSKSVVRSRSMRAHTPPDPPHLQSHQVLDGLQVKRALAQQVPQVLAERLCRRKPQLLAQKLHTSGRAQTCMRACVSVCERVCVRV
eukprot:95675-Chlamydomonas_euryale.AAC.1